MMFFKDSSFEAVQKTSLMKELKMVYLQQQRVLFLFFSQSCFNANGDIYEALKLSYGEKRKEN